MSLNPIVIRAPGFGGLSLENEQVVADAKFCRVAKNLVFDNAGRLASRQGYLAINDTRAGNVSAIFVYDKSTGATVITAMGTDVYETATDETNGITPTADHWQFQNFNDKLVGAQLSEVMVSYTGTGTLAPIAPKGGGTTDANGNCCHVAFGRIWTTKSAATTLIWCGLLDETEWPSATTPGDSGELNILSNEAAVRDGYDKIVAINHISNKLVVFLENTIIILSSPDAPASLAIEKTISNVGCIARDSVQQVGNDLVFMSRDGLRSLVRSITEDNFPLRDLSKQVRGALLADVTSGVADVKSAYYPDEGLYILLTTNATAWIFDFKTVFEDGLPRVTTWDVPTWHSIYYHEGILYIGQEGEYGKYSGYAEDTANYQIDYQSLNVDFDSSNIKNMKKTVAAMTGANSQVVTFTYDWEYGNKKHQTSATLPAGSTAGIYNTGVYGTATYGDGVSRGVVQVNPFGSGHMLSFGFNTVIAGTKFAMEQISHFATLGRISRGEA